MGATCRLSSEVVSIDKVRCPACGYQMPIFIDKEATVRGLFVKCKGKNCKHIFEIKVKNGKQVK